MKEKVSAPVLDRVADHKPLILPTTCEFDPQLERIRLMPNNTTAVIFFMCDDSYPFQEHRSGT
jgi:hypothetical protein